MKVIAHRCGTDRYPELTLESARYSLKIGASYVELDIRFTKDNIPVICHDAGALRLYGHNKLINDIYADDFLLLRYKENPNFSSISLTDILKSNIEPILFHIKEGGEKLKTVLEYIHDQEYENKCIMGVQTLEDLKIVTSYNKNIRTLGFIKQPELSELFIENGSKIIRLWEKWIFDDNIAMIKKHSDVELWVMAGGTEQNPVVGYTSEENILKWTKLGIDGVLVNDVEKTIALLRSI